MVRLLTVLIVCLSSFTAKSQKTFHGRIVDSMTRQPLEGASISEMSTVNNTTVSGQSGYFYLKTNSKDPIVIVNYVGYKTLLSNPGSGEWVFKMKPDTLSLKDVTLQ